MVGLSHHNAKVEVREKLAIPQDEWSESAQAIVDDSNGAIAEAAVLSTCNRFEVYFSARDARSAFSSISKHFQERSGLPMAELRESLFMLTESDASAHALACLGGPRLARRGRGPDPQPDEGLLRERHRGRRRQGH